MELTRSYLQHVTQRIQYLWNSGIILIIIHALCAFSTTCFLFYKWHFARVGKCICLSECFPVLPVLSAQSREGAVWKGGASWDATRDSEESGEEFTRIYTHSRWRWERSLWEGACVSIEDSVCPSHVQVASVEYNVLQTCRSEIVIFRLVHGWLITLVFRKFPLIGLRCPMWSRRTPLFLS